MCSREAVDGEVCGGATVGEHGDLGAPQGLRQRPGKNKYCRNFDFVYRLGGSDAAVVMTSVMGHLLSSDIVGHKRWAESPPEILFEAPIAKTVNPDLRDVLLNIEYEARGTNLLVIWTDCDREGENIGAEIADVCRRINPRIDVRRAVFSVVQSREIHHAMQHLVQLDLRKSHAVDARIEIDLRTGAALTRFLTLRFQGIGQARDVISYGSCQFPTLGFVVDQWRKRIEFVPDDHWRLQIDVGRPDGQATFVWARGHLFNKHVVELFHAHVRAAGVGTIVSVSGRPRTRTKPLPLMTVDLAKLGTKNLHVSSDQIMDSAERLYQQGLISYPRTETNEFEPGFEIFPLVVRLQDELALGAFARLLVDGAYVEPRRGGRNDRAHPPIHPTKLPPPMVSGLDRRVWELVARRFLACCAPDAQGMETCVELSANGELFKATGLQITSRGYLDVYPYERWASSTLPAFRQTERVSVDQCQLVAGKTSAPPLLTEPELIAIMDRNGIGTDATIHEHIKKILDRGYAFVSTARVGDDDSAQAGTRVFNPSTLGLALVDAVDIALGESEESLAKPSLRAAMERDLVAITEGRKISASVVHDALAAFRGVFRRLVVRGCVIEAVLRAHFEQESIAAESRPISEATMRCRCGLAAAERTVTRDGPNKGRVFYTCSKILESGRCGFFEWAPPSVQPTRTVRRPSARGRGRRGAARGTRRRAVREGV